MYTYKVMLKTNNKQRTKIIQTANKCIKAHNLILDYLMSFIDKKEKIPNVFEVRRYFTTLKKIEDEKIISLRKGLTKKEIINKHLDILFYDVSNDALKQTIKDTYASFIKWFKKLSDKPVYKSYKNYKKSFYVDPYKIRFTNDHVKLEKITNSMKSNRQVLNMIRLVEKDRIPINVKYYNPRVVIEGDRIFIVVAIDDINAPKKYQNKVLIDKVLGIDVNIDSIDLSDNRTYKSPIKNKRVRKIIKRGKRLQRKCSKKLLMANKDNKGKIILSNNFKKLNKKVIKSRKRIVDIYKEYHIKIINDILLSPPKEIHIEDLSINNMKKNHKLSHSIHLSSWGKFFTKLKEKCDLLNIALLKVDKFFPSSKMCHECGYINNSLTLKDRIFICPKCGYTNARDINASLNIRDYKFN